MTPGKLLRKQLRERPDFEILRAQTPLSVIFDPRLTHADRSLFDVVAFLGWPDNTCHQSTRDLADVAATDHHQVTRSLTRLFQYGHARRNKDGSISLTSPVFSSQVSQPSRPKNSTKHPKCDKCGSQKPSLDKMGVCVACRKRDQADVEVRGFLKDDPVVPYEVVYLGLKANGSKSSARELKLAFIRATDPPKRKLG